MEISPQASLADLVVQQPGRARVFERFGVDYCCHGRLSLAEACQEAGVEFKQMRRELEASDSGPGPFEEDWSAEPLSRLIEHIVEIHHNYLRCELPRLEGLMTKVAIHHGLRYHHLADLAEVFLAMKSELLEHMNKEERILFPMIRRLEAGKAAPMTVNNPISVMEGDHRQVSEALVAMRRLTNDYTPPQDGCTAFGALMAGLEELEEDLHQHIHKENNILFPRAEKLERELAQFV